MPIDAEMTELASYIGTRVHFHVHPLGICETGVLGFEGGRLWISTLPGVQIAVDGMTVHAVPFGPIELPGLADVSFADDERLIEIWRDREPVCV